MKKKLTKKLTNNLVYKIVAVLLAVILWLVVVNIDDPTQTVTIRNIPITILNANSITEQGKVYTITSSETAYVRVKGPRSYIDELKASDFEAIADFNKLSITNAVTVNVDWSDSGISNSNSVEIVESTTTISVILEDIISKTYNIEVEYSGEPLEDYIVNQTRLSSDTIEVSGPSSIINKIANVKINLDVNEVSADFSTSVAPKMYNYSGEEIYQDENTTLSYEYIDADVEIYNIRSVPINASTSGNPLEGYELSMLTLSSENVIIKGRKEELDQIESITIPSDVIDITDAEENVTFSVDINSYLPENVTVYEEDLSIMTVIAYIVEQGEKAFEISSADVEILNLDQDLSAAIKTNPIHFTLRGEGLESLNLSQISVSLDLSDEEEGASTFVLDFNLPEGIDLVSEVSVLVEITVLEQ